MDSLPLSWSVFLLSRSQSGVCCEIKYVSECLCALAVLYSNDLVDLPALICREAFFQPTESQTLKEKRGVSHKDTEKKRKRTESCRERDKDRER